MNQDASQAVEKYELSPTPSKNPRCPYALVRHRSNQQEQFTVYGAVGVHRTPSRFKQGRGDQPKQNNVGPETSNVANAMDKLQPDTTMATQPKE